MKRSNYTNSWPWTPYLEMKVANGLVDSFFWTNKNWSSEKEHSIRSTPKSLDLGHARSAGIVDTQVDAIINFV